MRDRRVFLSIGQGLELGRFFLGRQRLLSFVPNKMDWRRRVARTSPYIRYLHSMRHISKSGVCITRRKNSETTMNTDTQRSWGRTAGAVIFGAGFSWAMNIAFDQIPAVLEKTNTETFIGDYYHSVLFYFIVAALLPFVTAGVAAFLSRRRGVLTGLLANALIILPGMNRVGMREMLILACILLASIVGGYFGERLYSPDLDRDLGSDKPTFFGIRWFHYLWLAPLVVLYLIALLSAVWFGVITIYADLYFIMHPSLWLHFSYGIGTIVLFAVGVTVVPILTVGFSRLHQAVQYKEGESNGWRVAGKVLLYGLGAPILADSLASGCAKSTYKLLNTVRIAPGDWKIGMISVLIIPSVFALIAIYLSTRKRMLKIG